MPTVDIFILIVLCAFGVRSLLRGLIGEIMSIAGYILGYLCARLFGHSVGAALFGVKNAWLTDTGGYLVVFVFVLVLSWILSRVLNVSVKKTPVAWVNKAGGFLFGFILGATILGMILLVAKSVDLNAKKYKLPAPAESVFKSSYLANAVPRYTVCLLISDLKTCDAFPAKSPLPALAPPSNTPPAKPVAPKKK